MITHNLSLLVVVVVVVVVEYSAIGFWFLFLKKSEPHIKNRACLLAKRMKEKMAMAIPLVVKQVLIPCVPPTQKCFKPALNKALI